MPGQTSTFKRWNGKYENIFMNYIMYLMFRTLLKQFSLISMHVRESVY